LGAQKKGDGKLNFPITIKLKKPKNQIKNMAEQYKTRNGTLIEERAIYLHENGKIVYVDYRGGELMFSDDLRHYTHLHKDNASSLLGRLSPPTQALQLLTLASHRHMLHLEEPLPQPQPSRTPKKGIVSRVIRDIKETVQLVKNDRCPEPLL
jgi:hypothetical protein